MVVFNKISDNLYNVLFMGKETLLNVSFDGSKFNCRCGDLFNYKKNSLEGIKKCLESQLPWMSVSVILSEDKWNIG